MSKTIKLTMFGLILGVFCNIATAQAYGKYAAVWYNKDTKNTLRVIGDSHYGDDLNKAFAKNIQNALNKTKFTPFYISEMAHFATGYDVNSATLCILSSLTLIHYQKKDAYKMNISVIKKQPNLFSRKDRVMPRNGDFQGLSPLAVDLRKKIKNCEKYLSMDSVIAHSSWKAIANTLGLDKYNQVIQNKLNTRDFDNFWSVNNPCWKQLCRDVNIDFIMLQKSFLKICQENFKTMNANASLVTKVFLEDVGNHMLACEEILKKTQNHTLLKALQDLYHVLQKNLVLDKDSIMSQFIAGADNISISLHELVEQVDQFGKALYCDLPDFGFLAKVIQVMPFVENIVIYAGGGHIWGIEQHLKKAGYDCVWSQCNDDGNPLSQKDLEAFFSVKTAQKIKSRL